LDGNILNVGVMNTVSDVCGWCGEDIKVLLRTWPLMVSIAGLLICANYCSPECKECGVEHPDTVVDYLTHVKELMDDL